MAVFPSLRPTARTWTPGAPPIGSFASLSGYEVRVRYGSAVVGTTLTLAFDNVLEADAHAVTQHFAGEGGMYGVFDLPSSIYAGMTNAGDVQPSGTKWRYARSPSVVYVSPGIASVAVELVAVPV